MNDPTQHPTPADAGWIPHTCDTTEPNCGYNPCIATDPAVLRAKVAALRARLDEAVRLLREEHQMLLAERGPYADPGCTTCAFLATALNGEDGL